VIGSLAASTRAEGERGADGVMLSGGIFASLWSPQAVAPTASPAITATATGSRDRRITLTTSG
jgi:hypothetical protein